MFVQDREIRRRSDGSIDIDFYRQRGLMERRLMVARAFTGLRVRKALFVAAALALAVSVIPTRDSGQKGSVATGTALNSASLIKTANATR